MMECENERPVKKSNMKGSADENSGVKQHDRTALRLLHVRRAVGVHLLLVAAGDAELDNAQQSDGEQEREERDNTYVHCSSKNSALNPGPKAAASAYSPAFKGRFSSHSWRIKRMVALDSLPTFPRMSP